MCKSRAANNSPTQHSVLSTYIHASYSHTPFKQTSAVPWVKRSKNDNTSPRGKNQHTLFIKGVNRTGHRCWLMSVKYTLTLHWDALVHPRECELSQLIQITSGLLWLHSLQAWKSIRDQTQIETISKGTTQRWPNLEHVWSTAEQSELPGFLSVFCYQEPNKTSPFPKEDSLMLVSFSIH